MVGVCPSNPKSSICCTISLGIRGSWFLARHCSVKFGVMTFRWRPAPSMSMYVGSGKKSKMSPPGPGASKPFADTATASSLMSGPEVSGVPGAAEGAARPNGPASRNSLQFRLALPYVVLTVFVLGGLAIFVGSRIENIALDGLSESLEDQALIAADSIQRQVAVGAGPAEI